MGIHPREDSSNQSRKYARNQLRLDVLPLFEKINLRYREHILQLARQAQSDDQYLMEQSRKHFEQVVEIYKEDQIVISRKKFQTCDLALQRRMITLILSYLSSGIEWSSQHVEAVLHVIQNENPSAYLHLPNELYVKRVYQSVHFTRGEPLESVAAFTCDVVIPGTTRLTQLGVLLHTKWLQTAPDWNKLSKHAVVFDGERLPGRLYVRNRMPGDTLQILGSSGKKKLKELFIDVKMPKAWRDKVPLVMSGEHILWVPGVRRSALAQVDEKTTSFLYMEVEFGEEWQEVVHA